MSTTDETAEMLVRSAMAADHRRRRAWLSRLIWYPLILIVLLVIFLVSGFSGSTGHNRRFMRTIQDVSAIERAVESYHSELGHRPVPDGVSPKPGGSSLLTTQWDGLDFLNRLNGENPRNIRFMDLRESSHRSQGGAILDKNGRKIVALYDGWGNPYRIILDTQGDGVLVAGRGSVKDRITGKHCIIFSAGKDRELGTEDDFLSWAPRVPRRTIWDRLRSLFP